MDRPKQHRLLFLGLALLGGVALMLLARPWTRTSEPIPARTPIPTKQLLDPQPEEALPSTSETVPTKVPSPPPSTTARGFNGLVIDASTRRPVEQFTIQMIRVRREAYTEDPPVARDFTSATGHFVWTDLAAGTWRAAVSAPGYQMFNVGELQIAEGQATRKIVVPLLRGFAIHGRVFEVSTGSGIADAYISFRDRDDSERFGKMKPSTQSKDDGSFVLDGVPAGEIVLTVAARKHANRELMLVVDEQTPPQAIGLSTGATISGMVTTAAGAPAPGRVLLKAPGMGYFRDTNEAGQFSFEHMPPGQYRIVADTSAGAATLEFTLSQDEIKQDLTLIVGVGRSVRGVFRGLRTDQLQSARVSLRAAGGPFFTGRSDERGAYALHGVPPGRARLAASVGNVQIEKNVDVPADRDLTLDITIPTGGRLSGRITRGGKPVVSTNVWMSPVDDQAGLMYSASTSNEGQYEIEGLPPGDYRLKADEDITRTITMAGDAVLNIDIPLAQISARVVEEGAVPIVGANVYVRGRAPETAHVHVDKQTDDFGQFTLVGIEPGEIMLIVYKAGYEMAREKIAYSSPITHKTITLRKSAGVEVRIEPGSERFPRGFTLTQSFPNNDRVVDLWMPKDRDGVCHVPGALAGTTFLIGRFSGEPIVIEDWNGQPFELP